MTDKIFRIMVVDDETETAETIGAMASVTGHEVTVFTDPYRSLQSYVKEPYDLVITDLNMPNIDGFEIIKRMKEISKNTEFIIVTGEKNMKTVFQAKSLGVAFLIFKPVSLEILEKAIDTVYSRMYDRMCYWMDKLKEVGN